MDARVVLEGAVNNAAGSAYSARLQQRYFARHTKGYTAIIRLYKPSFHFIFPCSVPFDLP